MKVLESYIHPVIQKEHEQRVQHQNKRKLEVLVIRIGRKFNGK